ncbi:MAG TPA: Ig-like domain-containing protein [Caulobacter sp.]|nr:Ig-like domain-containing protein [Caulobacter sp.]
MANIGHFNTQVDELLDLGDTPVATNVLSDEAPLAAPGDVVAGDDTATANEPVAVSINVLANDTDLQGDALRVTHVEGIPIRIGSPVTLASGSTVRLAANGNLVFTSGAATNAAVGPGQSLIETFSYTVSDAGGDTDVGSVSVTVNGSYTQVAGTAGADVIFATDAAEEIKGFAGNDRLYGRGGSDLIDGGTGADLMGGGTGDDVYLLDDLGDVVSENFGAGTDQVISSVSFTLAVETEHLTLVGGSAINGTGNSLANQLIGNGLGNVLTGHQGADIIDGNGGFDTLIGGLQADRLMGGSGADSFVYNDQAESSVARGSVDVIYDYNYQENDRIDLTGIDASTRAGGNQDFSIVDSLTGTAGQLTIRSYGQMTMSYENGAGAGTSYGYILEGDTNGDSVADFTLLVNTQTALTVSQLSTAFNGLATVGIGSIQAASGGPATAQTTIPDLFA